MNDVQYIEAARVLAERSLKASSDRGEQIQFAFRRLLGRLPQPEELQVLSLSLDRLHRQYHDSPTESELILKQGAAPRDASINTTDHAAFTGVCLVLMNLDETLTRE